MNLKSPAFHWRALACCAVVLAASLFLVHKSRASFGKTNWVFPCKPGPWGNLECTHIAIEMPETFVSLDQVKDIHAHWFFKSFTRDQILALFKKNVSEVQFNLLEKNSKWEPDTEGIWVSPPDDLVLSLNPKARDEIYSVLARSPENASQAAPFAYRTELLPELLKRSGLQEASIEKFKSLLYTRGRLTFFADADVVVNHLPTDEEKIRFLKTISRTFTLLVKLKVDENSNLDELVDYWSYGGRKKDIRALLESMAAVPNGAKIDVAHLLTSFARQRIYTYPRPDSLTVTNQHCHWTSMNFLSDTPDDHFADNQVVQQTMQRDFQPVTDHPRFGDVFLFLDSSGSVIHSATYIADDILFTKNGAAANRPWIYMQLEDLRACYEHPGAALNMVVFRRKNVSL